MKTFLTYVLSYATIILICAPFWALPDSMIYLDGKQPEPVIYNEYFHWIGIICLGVVFYLALIPIKQFWRSRLE